MTSLECSVDSWGKTISSVSRWLAVGGGALIAAMAVMVTASATLRWLIDESLPGDIELVQMATAVAGFSFLPYCQLRRGNIFVETFTLMLSKRKQTLLDAAWDIVYAIVAALMGWRLVAGALDAISSQTVSFQLGISFGYLIFICALITGFLALTALYTALALIKGER
jgi:TRAP-type C4-dicarboxylate transport system permease small subunit